MKRLCRLYAEAFGGLRTSRALRGSLLLMKDVILEKGVVEHMACWSRFPRVYVVFR